MSIKNKAQEFGYDVSGLTDYTNANKDELVVRQVTEAKTLQLINIQEGVKHKEKIKIMNTSISYQEADCEMSADGDVVFSDREIAVAAIGFKKKLCNKDLAAFWTNQALKAGTMDEDKDIPFEEALVNYILKLHAIELDRMIWKSDSALTSGNLQFIDGFQKILTVAAGCTELNTSGVTAITNANAYNVVYECVDNSDESVVEAEDFAMVCGRQIFNKVIKNLVDLNFFHYSPEQIAKMDSVTIPGTDVTLHKVPGLNGTNQIYSGKMEHFTFGTDLEGDLDTMEIWYSQDDDVIYIRSKFRAGTQVPFLSEVGVWTPAV